MPVPLSISRIYLTVDHLPLFIEPTSLPPALIEPLLATLNSVIDCFPPGFLLSIPSVKPKLRSPPETYDKSISIRYFPLVPITVSDESSATSNFFEA